MKKPFHKAIVIGGSMAGLMAARVLADYFEHVLILERDALPKAPEPRKGVPQGFHSHAILESGRNVLQALFPGLIEELKKQGGHEIDMTNDSAWHHFGVWKVRCPGPRSLMLLTRPFLEWHVRRHIAGIAHVEVRESCAVTDFVYTPDRSTITGVRIKSTGEILYADLVVDASGRGSQTPIRLRDIGYEPPVEDRIGIGLAYTSRLYQPPKHSSHDWKFLVEYPSSRSNWRAGFITSVEGNRWIVSLNGYFDDHAPTDEIGFLEFAKTLTRPDLYQHLKDAQPLSEPVTFKIPASTWRHYERLSRFPERLLVLGDAVCTFNPIFGQGISVAAKEAALLHGMLADWSRDHPGNLTGLAQAVRKALPGVIRLPWLLARYTDLSYPQAVGKRPFGHTLLMWYVTRLIELTSSHAHVYQALVDVLSLQRGISTLFMPSVLLPVAAYCLKSAFVPLARRANTDVLPARAARPPSAEPPAGRFEPYHPEQKSPRAQHG